MKTPGQIAYEAWTAGPSNPEWGKSQNQKAWEDSAQAVLSSQWRSADDPPEDKMQDVIAAGGRHKPERTQFHTRAIERTHWMPIPAIPVPTEEQKSRAEFEAIWPTSAHLDDTKDTAWRFWQAARKSKEAAQ